MSSVGALCLCFYDNVPIRYLAFKMPLENMISFSSYTSKGCCLLVSLCCHIACKTKKLTLPWNNTSFITSHVHYNWKKPQFVIHLSNFCNILKVVKLDLLRGSSNFENLTSYILWISYQLITSCSRGRAISFTLFLQRWN